MLQTFSYYDSANIVSSLLIVRCFLYTVITYVNCSVYTVLQKLCFYHYHTICWQSYGRIFYTLVTLVLSIRNFNWTKILPEIVIHKLEKNDRWYHYSETIPSFDSDGIIMCMSLNNYASIYGKYLFGVDSSRACT